MQELGKRIAELRAKTNMTQIELAEKLGITDRAISKWENGNSYPDITFLPILADLFNVTIDYIIRGKSQTIQVLKTINIWNEKTIDKINADFFTKRLESC
ncbi:MAG: helix-turn-helix transcriptional regulator [Clostridia bacterium]|nr:helix-turn-helix transcriptional regulator [Clostridia bacterium]